MKDFAKSWEQIEWQSAADAYNRMQNYLIEHPNNKAICDYANERIEKLQLKFPKLKE